MKNTELPLYLLIFLSKDKESPQTNALFLTGKNKTFQESAESCTATRGTAVIGRSLRH